MQEEFKRISLKDIKVDPNQPRKHFEEKALAELSHSISQVGVMQPILVRPMKSKNKGKYMIVSGERRYQASLNAALEDIPCYIKELTDDEAFNIQIIENLQREDLNPMEEAEALNNILKSKKYNAKELAVRIGKKTDYVIQRVRLCDLIPEWQEVLYADKLLLSQANVICRFSPEVQKQFTESYYLPADWREKPAGWKVRHVHFGNNATHNLDAAPFETEDPTLNPKMGPCNGCRYNSFVSQLPFEGEENSRICSNPACYKIKVENSYKLKLKEAAADEDILLISDYVHGTEAQQKVKAAEELGRNVLPRGSWKELRKPEEPKLEDFETFKKNYLDDYDEEEGKTGELEQEIKAAYEYEVTGYNEALEEYQEDLKTYEEKSKHVKKAFVVTDYSNEGKMIDVYVPDAEDGTTIEEVAASKKVEELREKNKKAIKKDEENLLKALQANLVNADYFYCRDAELELTEWLGMFYLLFKRSGYKMREEICKSFGDDRLSPAQMLENIVSTGRTGIVFKWMRRLMLNELCEGSFEFDTEGLRASSFIVTGISNRYVPKATDNIIEFNKQEAQKRLDKMNQKIAALQQTEIPAEA